MSLMIEKLAKAMYDANGFKRPWETCNPVWRVHYRRQAEVALKTLREPTDEMIENAQHFVGGTNIAPTLYTRMIDTALGGGE